MKQISRRHFVGHSAALLGLVAISPRSFAQTTLLNASYDVAREFYKDYNPLFAAYWKEKNGETVVINQSHGGSTQEARAVIDGLAADVVTMNQASDIDALASHGLVASDWSRRFPDGAAPTYSTMLLLVRAGNPKKIHDWDDLARPGVSVAMVNPKTGGNGRYAYLAAYGYAKKHGASDADAERFMARILANVPILDGGGRAASSTFVQRQLGDVLVTFESETVQIEREFGAGHVQAVVPSVSILADNPVAVVERTVAANGHRALAQAYLQYLYADAAQDLAARHFLRVRAPAVMARYAAQMPPVTLFTVDDTFGGWTAAMRTHFADGGSFDRAMTAAHKS